MTDKNLSYEQNLWQEWQANPTDDLINEIIQYYMYLVDFHVDRIASHLPKNVGKDDIKSFGLLGLYDAIQKFELERQLKFDTYASFRIKGTIIDGLRKEDWLPRSLREKTKQIDKITAQLEQELERSPTVAEIASASGMTKEEVTSSVQDALFSNLLSIEEKPKKGEDYNEGLGYTIPDRQILSPESQVAEGEVKQELIAAIKNLNENEQMVISLFYDKELTLTEIGHVLDLTTSRISQIHKKALFKLKNILSEL